MSTTWKLMWLIRQFPDDFSMDSFQERKWLQKIVVLAQEFGIPMNYSFGWYRHGPYSTELADDGFTIDAIPEVSWNQYIDTEEMDKYSTMIARLKGLVEGSRSEFESMPEEDMLELLASLVFVANHTYPQAESKTAVFEELERDKSFSRRQMKKAWEILLDAGLVKL